ncbi:TetR/AcrR family transcriptional regulator [Alkalibacterium sp. MB6]|uniref:TetR/AcrR family transcriptional regulator n=1 Tax=Alkalibacterium sp. MB6 TaxID=2081965 RepID=UPI00137B7247|nr:TetR family transcriptional regulator [Alkalibacterium sp. MB6]
MEQVKTDPRVLRTRKMIIDSFIALSNKQPFHDISVKDITEEAMINRATFYNHFLDKYDLLEQVVAETLSLNLNCSSKSHSLSIEATIKQVFLSLVAFFQSSEKQCSSQEEIETVDSIIEIELSRIFQKALVEEGISAKDNLLPRLASLLTHSVLGMSMDYKSMPTEEAPEDYIDELMPFILNGLSI